MDAEIKAKWVAALRSGEYRQGVYQLHGSSGSYCCLGVLCVVANIDPGDWTSSYGSRDNDCMTPVESVVGYEMYKLAAMNDVDCKSFNEIADYIEANL